MTIDLIFSLYLAVDLITHHQPLIPQFPRYCSHAIKASCCACKKQGKFYFIKNYHC